MDNLDYFSRIILTSTPLDRDTTFIVGQYSEKDVKNLAFSLSGDTLRKLGLTHNISKEALEKLKQSPDDAQPQELIGRLTVHDVRQTRFIKAFNELISNAEIEGGEDFLEDLKGDIQSSRRVLEEEISDITGEENFLRREDIARAILDSFGSDYKTLVAERLVLHLLKSVSKEGESNKEKTIKEIARLSALSKENPKMQPFIKNVLNILEFNSKMGIEGEINKESLQLMKEILFENPNFARILMFMIPRDKLANCVATILNADFSGGRIDSSNLKGKLLLAALMIKKDLRLELPNNFLDKVSLETRGFKVYGDLGSFELLSSHGQSTLGDVLFEVDCALCKQMTKAKPKDLNHSLFDKLINEIVYLMNNRNYRLPFELTDDYRPLINDPVIIVRELIKEAGGKFESKKVDKDDQKKS